MVKVVKNPEYREKVLRDPSLTVKEQAEMLGLKTTTVRAMRSRLGVTRYYGKSLNHAKSRKESLVCPRCKTYEHNVFAERSWYCANVLEDGSKCMYHYNGKKDQKK